MKELSELEQRLTNLVSMHLDNDEYLYHASRDICRSEYSYNMCRDSALKDFASKQNAIAEDVLRAALAWVDWAGITDDIMEEFEDE